jgi:mRNA interferase RelE/StbE
MVYQIEYAASARKELEQLDYTVFKKVKKAIDSLAINPFPHGSLKLEVTKEKLYRIRKGDYRIIYSVNHNIITITILKIAHRSDAYKF